MSDIRLSTSFLGHVKTRRLMRKCKANGVLGLIRLWCYAADHAPKGCFNGMDETEIEDIAEWRGRSGMLVTALISTGWLDKENTGHVLHGWEEHQQWAIHAPERKERARRAARARWKTSPEQCPEQCDKQSPQQCSTDAPSNAPSPSPSPSPSPPPLGGAGLPGAEEPESMIRILRLSIGWTGSTATIEQAITRCRDAGLTEGTIRSSIHTSARDGMTPLDWASELIRKHKRRKSGGYAATNQAIPEAKPPTSIEDMAQAAGMTVEQYREYHGIPAPEDAA